MAKFEEDAKFYDHPSYGLVGFYRIRGGPQSLFGSSIKHHEVVRLRVSRATHKRDLSHDWYHRASDPIVEVDLSLTQFAEVITSFGHGDGFPCTLHSVNGEHPGEPPTVGKRAEFVDEFRLHARKIADTMAEAMRAAESLRDAATASKKDRAALVAILNSLHQEIASNMPFLAKAFNEQMDRTSMEAKGEVEAFFYRKVVEAGLEALVARGEWTAPQIEDEAGAGVIEIEDEGDESP